MVGGRPYCLSCLFTLSAVLLLTVSLPDVEASICSGIIDKKVGDTVEISSCLPAEGVTFAQWKQGDRLVADSDPNAATEFRDRFYLNPTNFSLTVRKLTLQDSGQFSFVSEVNKKQRETVSITLRVHEPITEQPDLQVNSTWEALHGSCTVSLQCSSTSDRTVILFVRNQTHSGSSLQFNLRPEDGETTITCTIFDIISEMSTSKTVKCSNSTEPPGLNLVFVLSAAVGGSALFAIIVGIVVCVRCCRQKAAAGSDTNDLTVYADVAEVAPENRTSTMKPCSVYETIENNVHPVTAVKPGPQTIYDQIQLNRVRKPSSPYQEI